MADYNEDEATLQQIKEYLRRKYFDPSIPPEPDSALPNGRLLGPKTREELEQLVKEIKEDAEAADLEKREYDDD